MTSPSSSTSRTNPAEGALRAHRALIQVSILVVLSVCLMAPPLGRILRGVLRNSTWSHAIAAPVVLLGLLYCRRSRLAGHVTAGSVWGIGVIVGGLGFYAFFALWPLNFGYAADIAIVPILAGAVLATCGWRVLKDCLPLLLVVLLSIPLGRRTYASLIIRPETYTLAAARRTLDSLPGVGVWLEGPDLKCTRGSGSGSIALGESNRGAALFGAYAVVGALVVFARFRPLWQLVVLGLAAVPIVLFCNFLRLMTWGVVTIYGGAAPTSAFPRAAAAVVSLTGAYVVFGLLCAILRNLVVDVNEDEPALEAVDSTSE